MASHYAEPVTRRLSRAAALHSGPSSDSEIILQLAAGTSFATLDDTLGWAWGYAGKDRRVGYIESAVVAPA